MHHGIDWFRIGEYNVSTRSSFLVPRSSFLVLIFLLLMAPGCAKEWRKDADRTYQNELQRCREFGCSDEERAAIGLWYRTVKAAIVNYEMSESSEDRKAARDLIKSLLDVVPAIEIKLGNSEEIGDDDVAIELDLISESSLAVFAPSFGQVGAFLQQNLVGDARPKLLAEGRFMLNGFFTRVYEGIDSVDIDATWMISGQMRLGGVEVLPNGVNRYPVLGGSFAGVPTVNDDQIPELRAALDTSSDRYVDYNLDGTIELVSTFRIEHGYLDSLGELRFGFVIFYTLEVPLEQVGDSYRISTNGLVAGDTVFPLMPFPISDWNRDGVLSSSDVADFLMDYNNGDPYTDVDGDGVLTPADISSFEDFFARSQGVVE